MVEEEVREETDFWESARKLYEKLDKPALLLLTAIIIFWIYVGRITYPTPNYNPEMDKLIYGPINWTGDTEALKHIKVPPTHVRTEHIAIGIALSLLLFYRLTHKELKGGVIGPRKARAIAEKYVRDMQQKRMPEVMGEILPGAFTLKHVQFGEAKQEPQKYVIETRIKQQTGNMNYFLQDINAKTGDEGRFIPRDTPFTGKDLCEKCGGYSDEKIVPEKRMEETRKAFGRYAQIR